jgi:hypothetical protein
MALLFAARPSQAGDDSAKFKHVLLISIDGMHAVDFINCSKGISGGAPYCPNLAKLAKKGVTYQDTSTSKPSDSFPGLTAMSPVEARALKALFTMSPMIVRSIRRRSRPETASLAPDLRDAHRVQRRPAQPQNLTKESTSTRAS